MEEWRFQFPSPFVTRRHQGDKHLAELYRGEANKLLFELKGLMSFRKLGQLKMTRLFLDGTIITAWSVFGMDFVNIDVRQTILQGIDGICSITLIDVPQWVAPMRNPGQIKPDERLGIDYHKTYYTVDRTNCQSCLPIEWNLCLNTEICKPFYFEDDSLPYPIPKQGKPDPNNHCVYTDSMCQAEIIKEGQDEAGTYIIWKAYTEGPAPFVRYTRSGQGFMKMRPVIKLPDATEACFAETIIDVDCCKKPPKERPVVLHWENCEVGFGWCPVPEEVTRSDIARFQYFSWILVPLALWVETSQEFSCLKHEWKLEGPGELILDDLTVTATWKIPTYEFYAASCHDRASIVVSDRCGGTDSFTVQSCCDAERTLAIGYTSLTMSCGGQQTLSAIGGCAPYTWAITSGGGSITPMGGDNSHAVYTAPSSNPNCTYNPTIRISDCCGKSAQISLAVNCYQIEFIALTYHDLIKCVCYKILNPECAGVGYNSCKAIRNYGWNCAGMPIQLCHFQSNMNEWCSEPNCLEPCAPGQQICPPPPPCTNSCACEPSDDPGCWNDYYCYQYKNCAAAAHPAPCNTLIDRRSYTKEQGCCPLNPFTGLPY